MVIFYCWIGGGRLYAVKTPSFEVEEGECRQSDRHLFCHSGLMGPVRV